MDFLDPKKQRRHAYLLYSGYLLIGIAIIISTIILVYQASGFGVNSKGQVVQNGLVFFSSQPNPADIYLNGSKNKDQTNTRLSLPAGDYSVRISRQDYRDWQRDITVQGGDVQSFDYPFLFPKNLVTTPRDTLAAQPGISAQSRDRRWLLVQQTPLASNFNVYDLKNPQTPSVTVSLPASLVTADPAGSWQLVQWADDNQHVLLKHVLSNGAEYILVDREDATKSLNLNKTLNAAPSMLTLIDNKYDQYDVLSSDGTLSSASISSPTLTTIVSKVITYKSYGSKTVLYATQQDAPEGKTNIMIHNDDQERLIRSVAGNTTYLLDMASNHGVTYVTLAASSENQAYIYKDPLAQLRNPAVDVPVASKALRIAAPTYLAFSPNTQFVIAEGNSAIGVYDVYLHHTYGYTADPLDSGQQHGLWMDGDRLTIITNGKVQVFDYDNRNRQTLMTAAVGQGPFFSPDYHYAYAISSNGTSYQLTATALLTAADL